MSIVGPTEARPAIGLTVDFVVESDRAQLREIVQRVRDARLRTNIGNVSALDDPAAALVPDAVKMFDPTQPDHRSVQAEALPRSWNAPSGKGDKTNDTLAREMWLDVLSGVTPELSVSFLVGGGAAGGSHSGIVENKLRAKPSLPGRRPRRAVIPRTRSRSAV